jgi:lipopolysaccharide/colanic/teichoic acid biosynthesis glycosyltransferase
MNQNLANEIYEAGKRTLDLIVASVLIIIFLPIWLIVPILIKLDSKGPIIFKHRRVGRGGREFDMYKFRSMIDNAHEYLHNSNPELLLRFKAADWKLKDDPRITRLGKILRSITIDEFPQLINVIKGDMSMVGPRAYMKQEIDEQVKKYPQTKAYLKKIFSIKPGITGPWQTSGRNEVPFTKRTRLDAKYAAQKSLALDLKILFKTPQAMLSKW